MNNTVIITGVNGQLGGCLQSSLPIGRWEEVLFPDRAALNLEDENQVRGFIRINKPSILLHAAAYTNVERAEEEPEMARRINADATRWIAEECEKIGTWLIYISTDYVFDGSKGSPYLPDDKAHPLNVYGDSKWKGEKNALHFNTKTTVVRASWIYSTRGKNFFKTMLALAANREALSVVADQWGAPTYALSFAKDLWSMMEGNKKGEKEGLYQQVLQYSPSGITSWHGFAKAILHDFFPSVKINPVRSDAFPQKAQRPVYSKLDAGSWILCTGVEPLTWEEQLTECKKDWISNERN